MTNYSRSVLLSNGQIRGENLRNGTLPGAKNHPQRLGFPSSEQDSPGPFTRRPQTPQRSFQRAAAGTHATPSPNLAHTGSQGETRGLLSPGHSVVLCCQRNCHRKNSRRKWMHALWRVSAFSGVAAPLGCVIPLLFLSPHRWASRFWPTVITECGKKHTSFYAPSCSASFACAFRRSVVRSNALNCCS